MSVYPSALPTVRPAVRSAFEQGSGGGAASIIAGLFAQGQQGFWLPFTDFDSLSQDAAGTLPYTALEQPVGRVLDRSGRGNHASQPTSTARGVVSARVNRLIATEELSTAQWSAFGGATVTDGGAGSSTITFAGGLGFLTQSVASLPAAQNLGSTFLLSVIANTAARVLYWGGATAAGTDVVTITPIGGGEWLQTVARTFTTTVGGNPQFQINNSAAGNGAVVTVRACSFVLSNQAALPYQRVTTPTDYDTVGFPKSLRVEVDDFYTCGGGGSTTGFYYSDVITHKQAPGANMILFSDIVGNSGYEILLNSTNGLIKFRIGNGAIIGSLSSASALTMGIASHVACYFDGATASISINGVVNSVALSPAAAGSATITLFKMTTGSNYFNGQITEPIYRAGTPPSAYEREVIRNYQMQKAGML